MKRILITLAVCLMGTAQSAVAASGTTYSTQSNQPQAQQERSREPAKLEHHIRLGLGAFGLGKLLEQPARGLALQLSYEMYIPLNESLLVAPMAGARSLSQGILHIRAMGGDFVGAEYLDLGAGIGFRLPESRTVLTLGPVFSYCVIPDNYYIDADPRDPRNGKKRLNTFELGIRPAIHGNIGTHWDLGVEVILGLTNALRQYPEYGVTQKAHLRTYLVTLGYRF